MTIHPKSQLCINRMICGSISVNILQTFQMNENSLSTNIGDTYSKKITELIFMHSAHFRYHEDNLGDYHLYV